MSKKDDYISLLQNHLPQGQAWSRDPLSSLTKLLSFVAGEFSRIDGRCDNVIDESDPRSTSELLSDWEMVAGLPDLCTGVNGTIQERRKSLTQKITGRGGQSRQYFKDLANLLGYDIDIIEHRPFVCGQSECGLNHNTDGHFITQTAITDIETIRHKWNVKVLGPRVTWFECGQSECGIDPFAKIRIADDLECLFARLKPAHTNLIFSYEG